MFRWKSCLPRTFTNQNFANIYFTKRPTDNDFNRYFGNNLDVDTLCSYTGTDTTYHIPDTYTKYPYVNLNTQRQSSLSSIPYPKLCLPKYISTSLKHVSIEFKR